MLYLSPQKQLCLATWGHSDGVRREVFLEEVEESLLLLFRSGILGANLGGKKPARFSEALSK